MKGGKIRGGVLRERGAKMCLGKTRFYRTIETGIKATWFKILRMHIKYIMCLMFIKYWCYDFYFYFYLFFHCLFFHILHCFMVIFRYDLNVENNHNDLYQYFLIFYSNPVIFVFYRRFGGTCGTALPVKLCPGS